MPLASQIPSKSPILPSHSSSSPNPKVVFAQSAASNGAQGQTAEQFHAARKARLAKRPCIGMCFLMKQSKLEEEAAKEEDEEEDEEYEEDEEEYEEDEEEDEEEE